MRMAKEEITIGTWTVQTLRNARKLELIRNERKLQMGSTLIGRSKMDRDMEHERRRGYLVRRGKRTRKESIGFWISKRARKTV